jgi:hypothetical protein
MPNIAYRTFSCFLAAVIVHAMACVGLAAQDDYKAKPLPAGSEAYTLQRYQGDKAKFWEGLLLADCKAGNALRVEWQPHVQELVSLYAELCCAKVQDEQKVNRMVAVCDQLVGLGCDDPIVQFMIADVRFLKRNTDGARSLYAAAVKGFEGRETSLSLRFLLQSSLAKAAARDKDEQATSKAAAKRDDYLVELAAAKEFGPGAERYYLDLVLYLWGGQVGADDLGLLERLERSAAKPSYPLLVLRGVYHTTMAWAARGKGAASTIGDTDRKSFAEHLRAAEQVLTQANAMCPQYPEAPSLMLGVLGPAGADQAEMRRWLDLAVAGQFDQQNAYVSFLHYAQPRWGGSQRALVDFGMECLKTKRFDTEVPNYFRMAIHYLALGSRDPMEVWGDKTVQQHLETLNKGYEAVAVSDRQKRIAKTHRIMCLALGGKAPEAAALCEEMGRLVENSALEVYDAPKDWLKKTLRPHFKDYQPATVVSADMFAGFETAESSGIAKARGLTTHVQATTARQSQLAFAKWISDTMVKSYDQSGVHDDAWDETARALLADFGSFLIGSPCAASGEYAKKLLAVECKDPLALYVVTRVGDQGDLGLLANTLATALPRLAKKHSIIYSWWAKEHLAALARMLGQPGFGPQLIPEIRKHLLAGITDPMFAGDNRRCLIRCLWGVYELVVDRNDYMNEDMIVSLGKIKAIDPWVLNVVKGLYYARSARFPKGSSEQRAEDLKKAAQCLGEAYKLCPGFPEAAVGMIIVSSLDPEGNPISPREWFDRALDAEIDYQPAYVAYVDSLRPRAGGSIQAMYRFAVECLDSARFDTDVPLWYARTIQRIQEEVQVPREAWASTGVAQGLDKLFQGYRAKEAKAIDLALLSARRCMMAWAGGRYAEALAAWDEAGKKIDPMWLEVVGVADPDLIEWDLKYLDLHRSK